MAKQERPKRDLARLGRYIAAARRAHFGTVSAAVAAAGVNTTTWNKAERGENIREDRLTAIEKALGWNVGDGYVIAEGGEPFSQSSPPATSGSTGAESLSDDELIAELQRRLANRTGSQRHSAAS